MAERPTLKHKPGYGEPKTHGGKRPGAGRKKAAAATIAAVAAAVGKLKPDRFACFVVGDYRDKRGFFGTRCLSRRGSFEACEIAARQSPRSMCLRMIAVLVRGSILIAMWA